MADTTPFENASSKPKSFWKRPEGVTGTIFMVAILGGLAFVLINFLPALIVLAQNVLYLSIMLVALAAIIYMVLDPKMRNLVWYGYKSVMRWITGVFVQIDPIGILKSYVEDLQDNLRKLSKQIGALRGQMRKLDTLMQDNGKEIDKNMKLASAAKKQGNDKQLLLASRKAARLQESNEKYKALHSKMSVMYRILDKMYQNSEILLEDTKDQVRMKEQERKAIRASHSAMKSAMSILSGDPDKRAMFDAALENIADDIANKVGEMERFMEMSANVMDSVDLQNGIFEEEGIQMLEQWEKESTLMLMEGRTKNLDTLDLNSPKAQPEKRTQSGNQGNSYENLFE
jgi:phage shock protein A